MGRSVEPRFGRGCRGPYGQIAYKYLVTGSYLPIIANGVPELLWTSEVGSPRQTAADP